MSNRTLPKPSQQTRTKAAARKGTYQKQTARLEGRRDGTPLIFGWGRHLTRAQKTAFQHRAAYSFFGVVIATMVLVGAFGWLQQNVLIPNQTIASVNSANISQDSYRKLLAYDAQDQWNTLQGGLAQYNTLQAQAQKGDQNATNQEQILIPQLQSAEAAFGQANITAQTAQEVVEDQLIQQGAVTFEQQNHVPASKFTPDAAAITKALNAFKVAFPKGETYQSFLSKNNLSNDDVRWAVAVHLRRDMMQNYLSSTYTSPTRQAHLLRMELGTAAQAQKARDQIVNKHADWTTLAKQESLDANTKTSGGDMGWVARGSTDAAVEQWALDPARKVGDVSPVIRDTSGTFDIIKVVEIDTNRGVDDATLSSDKQNALSHWLAGEKVLSTNHLTTPDATMVTATRNLPVEPDLNATLPQIQTSVPGAPGGIPQGVTNPTTGAPTAP